MTPAKMPPLPDADARRTAETAARSSYSRLLAILIAQNRDIAAAEDALATAFEAALRTWPARGIPQNPEAWLLTTARNTRHNDRRHRAVQTAAQAEIACRTDALGAAPTFPDDRLRLLFLCAHPALDPAIRTPLMLQTVLGLDAGRIARAFLIPAATMSQRLVRAKNRIRDAGLRVVLADDDITPDRLAAVLDAIYVAFSTGWDAFPGPVSLGSGQAGGENQTLDESETGLTGEAIYLARLLATLLPQEPEPRGLLAQMLYCEARRPARRDATGAFVALNRQDTGLWRRDMIIEAEGLLTAASRLGRFGRYLCEAAIQSVHVQRGVTGQTNHAALNLLYSLLHSHTPTTGVTVAHAAALLENAEAARVSENAEAARALALLDTVPTAHAARYQPYWVARARALHSLGQHAAARSAHKTALSLTDDPAIRAHLLRETGP